MSDTVLVTIMQVAGWDFGIPQTIQLESGQGAGSGQENCKVTIHQTEPRLQVQGE